MKPVITKFAAIAAVCLGGTGLVACAHSQPPTELLDARAAYQNATMAPGARVAQTDLYDAKKALDVAEGSYKDDGDSAATRDLAYVAQRKAISARAHGNAMLSLEQKQMAINEMNAMRVQQEMAMRAQLDQSKDALARERSMSESERQARIAAEQRTKEVLTLSGSVLFKTGQATLLPSAQKRISEVASALKADPRSFTVVGHTDSQGNDEKNMELSLKRAESVQRALVKEGVPADKVKVEGMGETQPIADNKSPEGRANNRRVEIVFDNPSTGATPGIGGSSGTSGAGGTKPNPMDNKKPTTPNPMMQNKP